MQWHVGCTCVDVPELPAVLHPGLTAVCNHPDTFPDPCPALTPPQTTTQA